MITEPQQEQAALFALGVLGPEDQAQFAAELRVNPELRAFLYSFQKTVDQLALSAPTLPVPPSLKEKILRRLQPPPPLGAQGPSQAPPPVPSGLRFLTSDTAAWKQLPIRGAWIKLLSFEPTRGYAILLGKLDPGVRYPAHINAGPEDFYLLTGDLHVGDRVLRPGDFHHADAGSAHAENYSADGCTLLAVLTSDDPLVQFAMA